MKNDLPTPWLRFALATLTLLACGGCWFSNGPEVVVYSALDREFSEPILADFEEESNIQVLWNFDIESTKTVGLAERIIRERNHSRCDVFWNNEILHTLRLQQEGLLDVYISPAAEAFPREYRSADGHWHGFAARARVLIVNTDVLPDKKDWPRSIHDLTDEKWKGKIAMAKPTAGTTATHMAVLFAEWGDDRAKEFFRKVINNVAIVSGNKQVAQDVAARRYAFGITDTDDAIIEKDDGAHIAIVYPDQGEDGIGTLFIPNTLCVIKNGPNPEHARMLVNFLLQPEVETRLANGSSAQFPINPEVTTQPRVKSDDPVRWMKVDFTAAAEKWDDAQRFIDQLSARSNEKSR